jgi:membrane protease YdiL (CAAX protease family)
MEVLFIFLVSLMISIGIGAIFSARVQEERQATQEKTLAHQAEQLLGSGDRVAIAVAVIMAVAIAPLYEEFVFRVLLQGWLESVWSRIGQNRPELRRFPISWVPIVLPAAMFAMTHLRYATAPLSTQLLVSIFLWQLAAELFVLGMAVALLRFSAGATAADMGWQPRKLLSDALLGLVSLLIVIIPIRIIQETVVNLVATRNWDFALDPVPLFFLALVFGWLYHRTHRIAPSLVLHMAFNATAVIGFFVKPG